jgi:hypothetical protein
MRAGFYLLIGMLWTALLSVPGGQAANGVSLVQDGKAVAEVVLPDRPTPVAQYAAQELVYHVRKATGATLPIRSESEAGGAGPRLYLGPCRATRQAGIAVEKLPAEALVLHTSGDQLFIAGNDGPGDPLDPDTRAGTLFGVYEWLEAALGVRWLWPGELGTSVPHTRNLVSTAADRTITPRLMQRRVRPGLRFTSENPALGFTPDAAKQYEREQTVYLRRHRMGRSVRMSYGHAFTDWWEKYGREHPDWFQQGADGKRGPRKKGARYSMCVSNPGLQQEIVARWKAQGGGRGSGPRFLNAVENDIPGLCDCERCKASDGPTPPDYLTFVSPKSKIAGTRFVSDRYARFWLALQQQAAQVNPEATVIGYAYFNYFHAPTSGVKLNPHVLLGYCPSAGFYPRTPDEHEWYKRQWRGWRETGARLFMRTNYFLDGYCLPYVFAHQFADDFQHAYRNGMVATDFDSLTGHWATQGPNLYLLMRLHTQPEASPDTLLAEYYAAFGPAAPEVKAYFDYWESYTTGHRAEIVRNSEAMEASRWRSFAKAAYACFPPACFTPAEAILARAAAKAKANPEAAARVAFLQKGLRQARLSVQAAEVLTLARPEAPAAERSRVLRELVTFRRSVERDGIDNFNHLAWVEDLSWKLPAEARQPAELYP